MVLSIIHKAESNKIKYRCAGNDNKRLNVYDLAIRLSKLLALKFENLVRKYFFDF